MTINTFLSPKRVAILNADYPKPFLKDKWGDSGDMAITLLENSRQENIVVEYVKFNAHLEHLPDLTELKNSNYVGIYITGSKFDAFSTTLDWVVNLRKFLSVVIEGETYPPVAGICFGHQVIAASLNCQVGRNPLGIEGGVVPIKLSTEAFNLGLFSQSDLTEKYLYLSEVHQDVVFDIPDDFINLGSSKLCTVQGLYKRKRVVTFQGHPEYPTEVNIEILREYSFLPPEQLRVIEKNAKSIPNHGNLVGDVLWRLFLGKI